MIKVYVMPVCALTNPAYQKRACAFLSEQRRAHAFSMKNENAAALCVGAGILLAYGLLHFYRDSPELSCIPVTVEDVLAKLEGLSERERENFLHRLEVETNPYGKSYFPWEGAPKFSVSHSGEYVAVAFSDREIGLDLQKERPLKNDAVYKKVLCVNNQEKQQDFFYLWTVKEAYAKYTGEGIRQDFTALFADREHMTVGEGIFFTFPAPEGYFLAVCTGREEDGRQGKEP